MSLQIFFLKFYVLSAVSVSLLFLSSSLRSDELFIPVILKKCGVSADLPVVFTLESHEDFWFSAVYKAENKNHLYLSGGCSENTRKTSDISESDEILNVHPDITARVRYRTWRKRNEIIPGASLYFATRQFEYNFVLVSAHPDTDAEQLKEAMRRFSSRIRFLTPPEAAITEETYRFRFRIFFSAVVFVLISVLFLIFRKQLLYYIPKIVKLERRSMEKELNITGEDFIQRIEQEKKFFLMDVRNETDHGNWLVRWTKPFPEKNVPYFDFIDDPEGYTKDIPKDQPVILICNRGNASDEIAKIMRDMGFDAWSVKNGMKTWGALYRPFILEKNDSYEFIQYHRLGKGCLSYVLISGNEAAIIDPARHIDQYLELLKSRNLTLKYIFDTHLHADHISGAAQLAKATGAAYFINPLEVEGGKINFSPAADGSVYKVGNVSVEVVAVHSPGHTPGSTSYKVAGKFMCVGDTMFMKSLGRPDLGNRADEWVKFLWNTVRKFDSFPDDLIILPTHTQGPEDFGTKGYVKTTLGDLRKGNDLMRMTDEKEFADKILSSLPEQPESYQEMRETNKGNADPDEEKMDELELGKNRCGVTYR